MCSLKQCASTLLIIAVLSVQRQLETLGAQRAGLEDMLKEMKRKVCLFNGINLL